MRLTTTKKKEPEIFKDVDVDENKYFLKINVNGYEGTMENVANKLGQLEDIEEDFNCNLIIFSKALKHGVFYKVFEDDKIKHTNNLRISCYDGKTFCLENKWHSFLMSSYGKTKYNAWALTKEELL